MERQVRLEKPKIKYSYGAYNKSDDKEQWIRITEGCPNNCPYCYEPQEIKIFDVPKIIRNDVKIIDMNLLCKKESLQILENLPEKVNGKKIKYELVCGIDHRFFSLEHSYLLKKKGFKKIRIAWDWTMKDQKKIKRTIDILKKVGYKGNEIMIFMICNWKVPYGVCCQKLDLCKIWNVQVADCYFDNQTFPNVIPLFWSDEHNKLFRSKCRKHNQLVNFGIDPEL